MKEFFKKKWVKRTLIIAVIAVLFGVLSNTKKSAVNYRTTEVESGDVMVVVSGSGSLAATESRKEISKVSARI